MSVREIISQKEVEDFMTLVRPHTFLSGWNWGEFEKSMGHVVWRLGVYDEDGGGLIALVTVAKTVARRGTFLVWHHGPIISPKFQNNTAKEEEIVNVLKEYSITLGKKEGCHFVRVATVFPDTEAYRGIFKKLGFKNSPLHLHSELGWILDITPSEDDIQKGMRKNTRYALRKMEKDGVTVVQSKSIADFDTFWEIYIETAKRQQFTPYSKKYVYNEFEAFLNGGQASLFFGMYKDVCISTAFVVYTANSGFYHHGASVHTFPGISASELIQWEAIREAKRRGCSEYNFWGVVPETAVKHPWYGLSKFKRGFGGAELALLHAQDYVISSRYWLTYIVEKIRKIRRGV
jgi:lipid II:glycine glycyltransferase (peptidoglycan interpeptide bridge formation enzyme)